MLNPSHRDEWQFGVLARLAMCLAMCEDSHSLYGKNVYLPIFPYFHENTEILEGIRFFHTNYANLRTSLSTSLSELEPQIATRLYEKDLALGQGVLTDLHDQLVKIGEVFQQVKLN